jgi:hypothetical protein
MHKIKCVRHTPPFPTKGSGQEVCDEPVMRDDHVLVVGERAAFLGPEHPEHLDIRRLNLR